MFAGRRSVEQSLGQRRPSTVRRPVAAGLAELPADSGRRNNRILSRCNREWVRLAQVVEEEERLLRGQVHEGRQTATRRPTTTMDTGVEVSKPKGSGLGPREAVQFRRALHYRVLASQESAVIVLCISSRTAVCVVHVGQLIGCGLSYNHKGVKVFFVYIHHRTLLYTVEPLDASMTRKFQSDASVLHKMQSALKLFMFC